jgi:hypothetical protein
MEASRRHNAPAALPLEKNTDKHWIADWVQPRARHDVLEKKKFPCRDSNPGPSNPYRLIATQNTLCRLSNISVSIIIVNLFFVK